VHIADTDVDDPELAELRVPTVVSKDVIRAKAAVKSVDADFVSTSVRRSDMSLACTIVPTAPTAPSPKPIRVWKAK
jgi:hypothetical protein